MSERIRVGLIFGGRSVEHEVSLTSARSVARALGVTPAIGRELLFDIGVDDSADGSARRCQLMWNGTASNSSDRTNWGRARLLR